MKKEIFYTDKYSFKYALILSDDEIKEGDWIYEFDLNIINIVGEDYHNFTKSDKKIIAHLPLTDAPILEGVPLLPFLPQGDDVDALAKSQFRKSEYEIKLREEAFQIGYNKAKEKYKYTEEDVRRSIEMSKDIKYVTFSIDEIIQSLQQPSRPTHFECEIENKIAIDGHTIIGSEPKTITNSQGQVELVGKYL